MKHPLIGSYFSEKWTEIQQTVPALTGWFSGWSPHEIPDEIPTSSVDSINYAKSSNKNPHEKSTIDQYPQYELFPTINPHW